MARAGPANLAGTSHATFEDMRALALLGLISFLSACGEDSVPPKPRGTEPVAPPATTTAALACPGDLAAPLALAPDGDVQDLHLSGDSVYFRTGTKVVRVNKDGSGRVDLYTSANLIRFFVDGKTLAVVESPNPPNALVRVRPLATPTEGGTEIGTDLVAAATRFFGADEQSLYAVGEKNEGDTFYRVARENGGALETLSAVEGVVTDPQLVGGTLWYVRDSKDVYRVGVEGDNREPVLVASVAGCRLAVGANNLYCTYDGAVEVRDLAGANPRRALDQKTSKVPLAFGGAPAIVGDALVVRSTGEGPLKNVLRSYVAGAEKIVACGRDEIGAMVTDGASAIWIEKSKGVFAAPIR